MRLLKGLSEVAGALLLLLVWSWALAATVAVFSAQQRTIVEAGRLVALKLEQSGQELILSREEGGIYAFNPGPLPQGVAYAMSSHPFLIEPVGVQVYPGEGLLIPLSASFSTLVLTSGALQEVPQSRWSFYLFHGDLPSSSGFFQKRQLNFSYSWRPVPGASFPFPAGANGSSFVAIREVSCTGQEVVLSLEGGKGEVLLDGQQLLSSSGMWEGSLSKGTYLLEVLWAPASSNDCFSYFWARGLS